jgi:hypothetical protein
MMIHEANGMNQTTNHPECQGGPTIDSLATTAIRDEDDQRRKQYESSATSKLKNTARTLQHHFDAMG